LANGFELSITLQLKNCLKADLVIKIGIKMRLDFWAILAEKLVTFVSKSKIYRLARDLTELSRKFLDQMPATYHEKSTKTFFA
jgi:hypothetical protein